MASTSAASEELLMTGLDPMTDEILEIACIITTPDLTPLGTNFTTTIHVPRSRLDQMGPWCTKTHLATGLTPKVLASTTTHEEAAEGLLDYIKSHVKQPRTALLAGNTVHMDKAFLSRPPYDAVVEYLHYRILDVSSIKEAARRWCGPEILEGAPAKKVGHRALDDILESIEEARYYMKRIFWPAGEVEVEARPEKEIGA
ncbi:related to oligoribonuclease [Cephalotrichum gorgonifer]|uniref:Related to oligoribonuclease n=1 Tax=Cephalotrichum gorgonifer TaxID=2041049 RepID=A0AAE8MUM8_9PEZI|nr:related to oligoribonuclease [Cephalotrichum gorgonifer]